MEEIRKLSSGFRNKEYVLIKEQKVTFNSWKNGIRRVQTKIAHFY